MKLMLISSLICAPVAQRIAHLIPIQKVAGSIPAGRAIHLNGAVAQMGEHYAGSVGVEGSIPFSSTNYQQMEIQRITLLVRCQTLSVNIVR